MILFQCPKCQQEDQSKFSVLGYVYDVESKKQKALIKCENKACRTEFTTFLTKAES